jgi:hypothetical protein
MAFSFFYLAVRALLGALVRSRRGLHVKDIELLVFTARARAPAPAGRAAEARHGGSGAAGGVRRAALVAAFCSPSSRVGLTRSTGPHRARRAYTRSVTLESACPSTSATSTGVSP